MIASQIKSSLRYVSLKTSLGEFRVYEDDAGALHAWWMDGHADPFCGSRFDPTIRPDLARQLQRYFAGGDADFSSVETPDGPEFFRRCWDACRTIPRGETRSYAWLAKEAGGGVNSARAAGQAMRHNPLPVIIPCHRVVASSGDLHGFAGRTKGAPINLKRALLELEGTILV